VNKAIPALALLLLARSACGADPARPPFPDDVDRAKLLSGGVHVERIVREGLAGVGLAFALDAPRDYVWNLITEPSAVTALYPDCDGIIVHDNGPEGARIEYRVTILLKKYRYVLDMRYDHAAYRITWREGGGDFRRIGGSWTILESGRAGTSLLFNESLLDTGFALPEWFETWIKLIKTRDVPRYFRRWVERHPPV
jgi:hypothetical protein